MEPHMTSGKVCGCLEFVIFAKNLKIHEKIVNSQKNLIFILSMRKCWKIEQQLKVEIEDGCEAPG